MTEVIEEAEMRNKTHVFRDRFHAGELLTQKLKPHMEHLPNPIVLAIPSGGVPVGSMIAKELGIQMDLIIVRKIPVPYDTEAGFGSISWEGEVKINKELADQLQLRDEEIKSAINKVKSELDRRMVRFRGKRLFPDLRGRSAIIVDDGLASGYTMLSAISAVRKHSPARVAVAVPTGSRGAVGLVAPHVDEIFCLNVRETMVFAVADAYWEWHDLGEEEVMGILRGIF